jgi:hypothetical protein
MYVLPRVLLVGPLIDPALGEVSDRLLNALGSAGYTEGSFYSVPGGFALVTRLEQISSDGRPKQSPDRWTVTLRPLSLLHFSLSDYLSALFHASPGFYRVIAFVVSPRPFNQDPTPLTRDEALALLPGGVNVLPEPLRAQPYAAEFACTALVYEFQQAAAGENPTLRLPSSLTGEMHLVRSAIMMGFGQ